MRCNWQHSGQEEVLAEEAHQTKPNCFKQYSLTVFLRSSYTCHHIKVDICGSICQGFLFRCRPSWVCSGSRSQSWWPYCVVPPILHIWFCKKPAITSRPFSWNHVPFLSPLASSLLCRYSWQTLFSFGWLVPCWQIELLLLCSKGLAAEMKLTLTSFFLQTTLIISSFFVTPLLPVICICHGAVFLVFACGLPVMCLSWCAFSWCTWHGVLFLVFACDLPVICLSWCAFSWCTCHGALFLVFSLCHTSSPSATHLLHTASCTAHLSQAMSSSPFALPFMDRLGPWEKKLVRFQVSCFLVWP